MIEIEHLSYSSISTYLMCPASWKFRYIDKPEVATGPALVFGTAVHGAIESLIHNDHQGDILTHWHKGWTEAMARQKEVAWDDSPESYFNQGLKIITAALPQLLSIKALRDAPEPGDTPETRKEKTWIEREFKLRVPGVPVPILGYIDIVTEDGVPGDFKTSSRSWRQSRAEEETQPLFYLAALNQMGKPVPDGRFRHYVLVKTKTPQFQVFEHTHTAGAILTELVHVKQVWDAIEKEVFPTNYSTWKCSAKWCEYWSRCRGRIT